MPRKPRVADFSGAAWQTLEPADLSVLYVHLEVTLGARAVAPWRAAKSLFSNIGDAVETTTKIPVRHKDLTAIFTVIEHVDVNVADLPEGSNRCVWLTVSS